MSIPLGTRVASRSVRRSCTARCEGLALLGAKVLHRSVREARLARAKLLCSLVQSSFARPCKALLLARAKSLCLLQIRSTHDEVFSNLFVSFYYGFMTLCRPVHLFFCGVVEHCVAVVFD